MKCPSCNGRGYEELLHGVFMKGCELCKGTGEVPAVLTEEDLKRAVAIILPEQLKVAGIPIQVIDAPAGTDHLSTEELLNVYSDSTRDNISDQQSDNLTRSANTSKPRSAKESKAVPKPGKRSKRVLPKTGKSVSL